MQGRGRERGRGGAGRGGGEHIRSNIDEMKSGRTNVNLAEKRPPSCERVLGDIHNFNKKRNGNREDILLRRAYLLARK